MIREYRFRFCNVDKSLTKDVVIVSSDEEEARVAAWTCLSDWAASRRAVKAEWRLTAVRIVPVEVGSRASVVP